MVQFYIGHLHNNNNYNYLHFNLSNLCFEIQI